MHAQTSNNVWLCDFTALCIRLGYGSHHAKRYDSNYVRKIGGIKNQKKNATYYAKWTRYQYRDSKFAITEKNPQILYEKGIELFAIQDSFSRFILGYALKENPTNAYTNYLYWFDVNPTFEIAFKIHGYPFELISDSYLLRLRSHSSKYLRSQNIELTRAIHPCLLASLDSFFFRIQYELRTSLTNKNVYRYVQYWNYYRPHSSLNGFTPSCAYLCGSQERFNSFIKNALKENRKELLNEVKETLALNFRVAPAP